jgi:hypothetical protein
LLASITPTPQLRPSKKWTALRLKAKDWKSSSTKKMKKPSTQILCPLTKWTTMFDLVTQLFLSFIILLFNY